MPECGSPCCCTFATGRISLTEPRGCLRTVVDLVVVVAPVLRGGAWRLVMVDGKPLTRDDRQRLGERHADHHLHYRSRAFPRKSDHSCRRRCAYLPDFVIVDRDSKRAVAGIGR